IATKARAVPWHAIDKYKWRFVVVPLANCTTPTLVATMHISRGCRNDPPDVPQLRGSRPMSQTDTKPGFRLPWTGANADAGAPAGDGPAEAGAAARPDPRAPAEAGDEGGRGAPQPSPEERVPPDMIAPPAGTSARRPTKFMADLSRAMQTAAEASRDETMTRF